MMKIRFDKTFGAFVIKKQNFNQLIRLKRVNLIFMMIEESNQSEVEIKKEQRQQQDQVTEHVNQLDHLNENEAEQGNQEKAQDKMNEQNIEQPHQDKEIENQNEQDTQQQPIIHFENIYRKKSQLLSNLKLKTYDVNEDEDQPGQTNQVDLNNQRVITIEMAQQEDQKAIVHLQKEQDIGNHLIENNSESEQIQRKQTEEKVEIQVETKNEVEIKEKQGQTEEVKVNQGESIDQQQSQLENVQEVNKVEQAEIEVVDQNKQIQAKKQEEKQQVQNQGTKQKQQEEQQQEEKQSNKQAVKNQQEIKQKNEKDTAQIKQSENTHFQQLAQIEQNQTQTNQVMQVQKQLNAVQNTLVSQNKQQPIKDHQVTVTEQSPNDANRQLLRQVETAPQITIQIVDSIDNQLPEQEQHKIVEQQQQKAQNMQQDDVRSDKNEKPQNQEQQKEQPPIERHQIQYLYQQNQKDSSNKEKENEQEILNSQEQQQQVNQNRLNQQNIKIEVQQSHQEPAKTLQNSLNPNQAHHQQEKPQQEKSQEKELQKPNQFEFNQQPNKSELNHEQLQLQTAYQVKVEQQSKKQEVVKNDQKNIISQQITHSQQKQNHKQINIPNQLPHTEQTSKSEPFIVQSFTPEQKLQPAKPLSFKSRKLQRLSQLNESKQVVRNRSLHSLVTTIHKTQQNPIKLPLHRPSNSQKKVRGKSPNLNRLKYNIGLDSKIIDLTVGEIFEQKGRKNDEMKSMLLKQIETLKEQIDVYERQENDGKRESFTQPVQGSTQRFHRNTPRSKSKHQQFLESSTHRQQISQLYSLNNKKENYYTPRGPKFPIISPGEIPSFDDQLHGLEHTSLLNESPQRLNDFLISSPQKRGNVCGRIVRKYNHDTLRNSQINNTNTELSRTLVNGNEDSFVKELSSNEVMQSLSKVSQGSRLNERGSKKKIGSIISLREVSSRKKEQKESEVEAPLISQLQQIPLPQKYKKQLQLKSLKQLPWSQLYTTLNNQLNPIITKTQSLTFPTPQSSQQQLVHFAHSVFFSFGINIQSEQFLLNIKRYKNCIVFGLTNQETIICHFEQNRKIYYGGWNGKEKEGWGFEVTEQNVYKGQWKANRKSGVGVMRVKKSERQQENLAYEQNQHKFVYYAGNWQNNSRHNFGIQLESTSNHVIEYQGNWVSNKKTGKAAVNIYSRKSSNLIQTYKGQFLNGQKHGFGLQLFANGDKYEGNYVQNKFDGKGKYQWKNGSCYVGYFVQGSRDGKGQWFSDGEDLEVMENLNQNNGTMTKLKGDYYRGEYKCDKKNGFGIYRWKNGTIYEGEFENDQKVGEGMLIVESDATFNAETKVKTINNNFSS